jgi:hypothetical protein
MLDGLVRGNEIDGGEVDSQSLSCLGFSQLYAGLPGELRSARNRLEDEENC